MVEEKDILIEKINQVIQENKDLRSRIEDLERVNDQSLFTCYMSHPNMRVSVYRCIEMAVSESFGINYTSFYDSLVIGYHNGKRGRDLPLDPVNFKDEYDKIIVARQCLFGIMHVDFHVPVQSLWDFYSVDPRKYIDKWRDRYIRVFKEDHGLIKSGEYKRLSDDDIAYKNYYITIFKKAVEITEREGVYDELINTLTREGLFYNRLKKWRIS